MNDLDNTENIDKKKNIWLEIGRKLLFPHIGIVFFLFNLTLIGLIYIFANNLSENIAAILFYMVTFYTLIVVVARIPGIVKAVKTGLYKNRYSNAYLTDKDLRMRLSMYRGLLINFCFATFKIILGFMYNSPWLFAMAGYNVILSLMRFIVIFRSQAKGLSELEEHRRGLQSYKVCGWLILFLNIAVSVIVFMVVVHKQTIVYNMIAAIGLATFTFYCFIMAIINMVKYRERTNPVYATIKRVDMVKAIVSVFTLQVTMLTSFSGVSGTNLGVESQIDIEFMNRMTGYAVIIAINTIGAMMLAGVKKDFKELETYGE